MGVLRVRAGGVWVDVGGGSDPIWVDPTAPTDPNYELWYDTDATAFSPDTGPRGNVGLPAVINADQTGIAATVVDLTGFTVTFNVIDRRYYKISWLLMTQQNTTAGTQDITVDLAGASTAKVGYVNPSPTGLTMYNGSLVFAGGAAVGTVPGVPAGSKTIKLRGSTSAGTMTLWSGSLLNGRFWAEDIGAV